MVWHISGFKDSWMLLEKIQHLLPVYCLHMQGCPRNKTRVLIHAHQEHGKNSWCYQDDNQRAVSVSFLWQGANSCQGASRRHYMVQKITGSRDVAQLPNNNADGTADWWWYFWNYSHATLSTTSAIVWKLGTLMSPLFLWAVMMAACNLTPT